MSSLGSYLSGLRQGQGLSVEDVARATRIAAGHLEALEADDFGSLPAPVFAKGFIRAYCQVLGVPADEALARYDRNSGGRYRAPAPARSSAPPSVPDPAEGAPRRESAPRSEPPPRSESGSRSRGTVLVSFVLLVVLGLALFGVSAFLKSGRERVEQPRARNAGPVAPVAPPSPAPAASPTAESLEWPSPVGTASATVPPPPAPARPAVPAVAPAPVVSPAPPVVSPAPVVVPPRATAPAAPPAPVATPSRPAVGPESRTPAPEPRPGPTIPAGDLAALVGRVASPYRLVARVTELTWIRVRMEDGRFTEETIPAGQVREWISDGPFVLTVGNAGGVTLELNGRELPPLGARGAVIGRLVIPPAQQ